jgi:hypothetical protein
MRGSMVCVGAYALWDRVGQPQTEDDYPNLIISQLGNVKWPKTRSTYMVP